MELGGEELAAVAVMEAVIERVAGLETSVAVLDDEIYVDVDGTRYRFDVREVLAEVGLGP